MLYLLVSALILSVLFEVYSKSMFEGSGCVCVLFVGDFAI
jgi:hypothetical protein